MRQKHIVTIYDKVDTADVLDFTDIKKEMIAKHRKQGLVTGVVDLYNDEGELVFKGFNKVVVAGGEEIARGLFPSLPGSRLTPTYNNALSLDNTINVTNPPEVYETNLFCVGTGGCGRENSDVWEPPNVSRIGLDSIIPFQVRPLAADISIALRQTVYMGRKTDTGYIKYYFKRFDTDPVLVQEYSDGTPMSATLYSDNIPLEGYTHVDMQFSITKDDCREHFYSGVGLSEARWNEISLCKSWIKVLNDIPYHQDIRPITRLTIPNEVLINLKKSTYGKYSLYM